MRLFNFSEPPWYGLVCPVVSEGWCRAASLYPDTNISHFCHNNIKIFKMKQEKRNYAIDLGKTIAIYFVVALHISPGDHFSIQFTKYFFHNAVPFFCVTSLYFLMLKEGLTYKDLRVSRLLLPYICWSLFYFLLRLLKHIYTGEIHNWDYIHVIFFGGVSTGLYFIPMLLMFHLFAISLIIIFSNTFYKNKVVALSIIIAFVSLDPLITSMGYLGFKNISINSFCYTAIALLVVHFYNRFKPTYFRVCTALAGAFLLNTFKFLNIYHSPMTYPLIAGCLLYALLHFKTYSPSPFVKNILSTSFGVYLVHQLFDRILQDILPHFGLNFAPYDIFEKTGIAMVILILSVGLVLWIRKIKYFKIMLLGETAK